MEPPAKTKDYNNGRRKRHGVEDWMKKRVIKLRSLREEVMRVESASSPRLKVGEQTLYSDSG